MIYNYPYFGLPNYNKYINHCNYINMPPHNISEQSFEKNNKRYSSVINTYKKNENKYRKNNSTFENIIIEIFGIKLNFDDVLIICILLFLCNEKTNDTYLILSLILLLLS